MSTKGLTEQELKYIPELFDGVKHQLDHLLYERRADIFRELKSATQKAIETGEDCGKIEVKLRTVITSGGVICGYKSSLEYITQFKVKDESGSETFDPTAPDLFDKAGNASEDVKKGLELIQLPEGRKDIPEECGIIDVDEISCDNCGVIKDSTLCDDCADFSDYVRRDDNEIIKNRKKTTKREIKKRCR